jgi:hypothetical protein
MLKFLSLTCASLLLAMTALVPAYAGEASRASNASYIANMSTADTLFRRVASKPCCYNNGDYFNSTPKTCNKYGGRVVPYEYCERGYRGQDNGRSWGGKPCCYANGQFFNAGRRTCQRYGGTLVRQERCDGYYNDQQWYNDNDNYNPPNAEKPCCYNNGRYYNSTPKTCNKYGGRVVAQHYCSRPY